MSLFSPPVQSVFAPRRWWCRPATRPLLLGTTFFRSRSTGCPTTTAVRPVDGHGLTVLVVRPSSDCHSETFDIAVCHVFLFFFFHRKGGEGNGEMAIRTLTSSEVDNSSDLEATLINHRARESRRDGSAYHDKVFLPDKFRPKNTRQNKLEGSAARLLSRNTAI